MKKLVMIILAAVLAMSAFALAEGADNDAILIGNWETTDQMTVMTIGKNPGGEDWDVEITGAQGHGAYVFKTTIRCGDAPNCFTYNKGKFWQVPVTDGTEQDQPLGEADIAGSIGAFTLSDDKLTLTWVDDETANELELHRVRFGDSECFTDAELSEAAERIMDEFSTWAGCEMHSVRYAGDAANNAEKIAWLSELKGKSYAEVAEFLTDFHSPVEERGAWEADTEYTDYEWWLAREAGGAWELVTWGY